MTLVMFFFNFPFSLPNHFDIISKFIIKSLKSSIKLFNNIEYFLKILLILDFYFIYIFIIVLRDKNNVSFKYSN